MVKKKQISKYKLSKNQHLFSTCSYCPKKSYLPNSSKLNVFGNAQMQNLHFFQQIEKKPKISFLYITKSNKKEIAKIHKLKINEWRTNLLNKIYVFM